MQVWGGRRVESKTDWQWLDETARTWRWYEDGTPSDPAATDKAPSLTIDPAVVSPPGEPKPEPATTSPEPTANRLLRG